MVCMPIWWKPYFDDDCHGCLVGKALKRRLPWVPEQGLEEVIGKEGRAIVNMKNGIKVRGRRRMKWALNP